MPATEFHHQKDGVLVSWGHACGHFSNPMYYAALEFAEAQRSDMEGEPCWECRNAEAVRRAEEGP